MSIPQSLGLADLHRVELSPMALQLLQLAELSNAGDPASKARKRAEARSILALCQLAPQRLQVGWIDLRQSLRALLMLTTPVPCTPDGSGGLRVQSQAVLGLTYPPEAVRQSLPGTSFIQVLEPRDVWHANVHLPEGTLCLGPSLPAGIRVKSLILLAYGALTMQSVQIDEFDPAGVMNAEAARWWQQNMHRVPLSREPFLMPSGQEVVVS